MSSQSAHSSQDPNAGSEPPELDINGNPIPRKSLFAAPAAADTPPPETTKAPAARRPPVPATRPAAGSPLPPPAPILPGDNARFDLSGNPLPSNAPPLGGTPGAWAPSPHGIDPIGGAGYGRRYTTTVNGGLILALGILGLILCPLLAPVAWVMGNNALGAIDRGEAGPAPRGQTNAGRVCGIIGTVLTVLGLAAVAALSILNPVALKSFMPGAAPIPYGALAGKPVHGKPGHDRSHAPHHTPPQSIPPQDSPPPISGPPSPFGG